MAENVPEEAPPNAEPLLEWAEDHAERVGVASAEDAGTYEVTVEFEGSSLLLVGVLGEDGDPGLWESASLAHWDGIETEARMTIPERLSAPPVVLADDGSTVTVRTTDAEIDLSVDGESEGETTEAAAEGESQAGGESAAEDESRAAGESGGEGEAEAEEE